MNWIAKSTVFVCITSLNVCPKIKAAILHTQQMRKNKRHFFPSFLEFMMMAILHQYISTKTIFWCFSGGIIYKQSSVSFLLPQLAIAAAIQGEIKKHGACNEYKCFHYINLCKAYHISLSPSPFKNQTKSSTQQTLLKFKEKQHYFSKWFHYFVLCRLLAAHM